MERLENENALGEVSIPSYMRRCSADSACAVVSSECSYCCGSGSVNAAFVDRYEREFLRACEGYAGGFCDCISIPVTARCVEGWCEAVGDMPEVIR